MRVFWLVLGTLWALPATLAGALIALFCKPRGIRWKDWTLEISVGRLYPKWAAAQCYGSIILYRSEYYTESLRSHECIHVRQAYLLGVFMLIIYPLGSLLAKVVGGHTYYHNPFEMQAYALQKKEPNERQDS